MSRLRTTSEMLASGEATPQDVRNRQLRDAKYRREYKRMGEIPALIKDAVGKTNPEKRQIAEQEIQEWHRRVEGEAFKSITNTDLDELLDTDILTVNVGRLRELTKRFADLALECASNDQRCKKMRDEMAAHVADEIDEMTAKLLEVVQPSMGDAMRRGRRLQAYVYNNVG